MKQAETKKNWIRLITKNMLRDKSNMHITACSVSILEHQAAYMHNRRASPSKGYKLSTTAAII